MSEIAVYEKEPHPKRKAISTSKYYLFDIGLARHLQGRRGLAPGTSEYGAAFESFIFQDVKAFCDYHRLDTPQYWRSKSRLEVDFVFEDLAVETKATRHVSARDLRGLRALREEGLVTHYVLVSMEPLARLVDGIRVLPWTEFLDRLWRRDW
jgi:predicted AAA+ superfamily ATPase